MATIVAGRFDTFSDAERAARGLYGHGLSLGDVSIFTVSPAEPTQALPRPAGVLLAARVEPRRCEAVAEMIRAEGGRDLEQAEGKWEQGRWTDFDPMVRPTPMPARSHAQRASDLGEGALSSTGNEDPGSEIDQSIAESGRGPEDGVAGASGAGATQRPRDLGVLLTPAPDGDAVSPGDRRRAQAQAEGQPRQSGRPDTGRDAGTERHAGAAGQGPVSPVREDAAPPKADGSHPAGQQPREAWESAASHASPEEQDPGPQLVRGHTTTPEPRDDKDTLRQMRRGEFPPGVGKDELNDPGNTTPGAPNVDNRS